MTPVEIVLIVLAVLVGLVLLRFLLGLALFVVGLCLMGIADALDSRRERKRKRRLRARR